MQNGDLVGVQTRSGPRLALVTDLHGSKAAVLVGFEAKPERLPLRDLDLISPLPPGAAPAASLGALPWQFSAAALTAATPSRRDLAAAWLLLEGEDGPMALDALVELLAPEATALALAACWLLLPQQDFFRWRQGQVQRRSRDDLHQLRRDRRKLVLRESRRQLWYGLLAAAGTPAPLVARMAADLAAVTRDREFQARLATQATVPDWLGPEDFAARIRAEVPAWAEVARAANMRAE